MPADDLAAGLAEEIITGLSRFRWISCIPASSSDVSTGERSSARRERPPDYDFKLDGTIQRTHDRVRIMARLHDMHASGSVVWARRFDHAVADAMTVQENLGAAIVAQIDPELLIHVAERNAARNHADPTAHDLVLRAIPSIYRLDHGGFNAAGELLEAAIVANPRSSVAHAWFAYWHLFLVGQGWAQDPNAASTRAVDLAERAVTLDPGDARALTLAGHVRGFLGRRPEEATTLHDRALALNPNLALAWCFSGLAKAYRGDYDEAEKCILRAVRLSPSDPHLFFFDMALTMPYLLRGDYATAAEIGRRAIELNPGFSSSYKGQLAALGHLGWQREAGEALSRLLVIEPRFSVAGAIARSPMQIPADIARYAEGLRLAGVPEG
jgi:TolB-like protein/Flp pilus assembly protein TadD